jgi:DNA-binding NarL/FixJ family response regulator
MEISKNVLIVDDSPIIVDRLLNMLRGLRNVGDILSADSYATSIEQFAFQKIDVAILDINLPDKNGLELLRLVKNKYANTIVIMLTNQSGEYYRSQCKLLGADFFLDKSTEFERIPEILASL